MGLCFSHNTEKHGKKHYPYAEITPLAILLWTYFFPDPEKVGVILYLIHTEPEITPHLQAYERSLKPTGVNLVSAKGLLYTICPCIFKYGRDKGTFIKDVTLIGIKKSIIGTP